MKIGIVTYYKQNNYGSLLQAFSLHSYLCKKGHSSVLIDVSPVSNQFTYNKREKISKQRILNFERKILLKLNVANYRDKEKARCEIFDNFRAEEFSVITINKDINNDFDAFVVGSDQIWNCSYALKKVYFLDFVESSKLKIAYAPSFATTAIPDKFKNELRLLLERFDAISVRERQGKKILHDLIDIDIPVVCDPTMLYDHEYWHSWAGKPLQENEYILCYFLGDKSLYWKKVKELSEKLKKKVIVIPATAISILHGYECVFNCGPREFVNLVSNASFVCTDSFHGMVFSIICHRNFIAFKRFNNSKLTSQNSRVEDLLFHFDLGDKLVNSVKDQISLTMPDYDYIDKIMYNYRKQSEEYLKKSLNINKQNKE